MKHDDNNLDKANTFNYFFCSIGKPSSNLTIIENPANMYDNIRNNNKSLFLSPTNYLEIEQIVRNISSKTRLDFNDSSFKTIKSIIQSISKPLSNIFNKSLYQGVFPSDMKVAKVVIIHKKGIK